MAYGETGQDLMLPDDDAEGYLDADFEEVEDEGRVRPPLTDEELHLMVQAEIQDATGTWAGQLAQERIDSMRYYLGEPRGDELPGRSQVISQDIQDVLEWIKPQMMSALLDFGSPVVFDPEGPEDEEQAKLESQYTEHAFKKDNDAFVVLYSMITDALMQRNGVVKVYPENKKRVTHESYTGIPGEMLPELFEPQDGTTVEPLEGEESGPGLYDLTLRRTHQRGAARVANMPPEEFGVARDHNSIELEGARFTFHVPIKRAYELLEEGWDWELVDSLPDYALDVTNERDTRRELEDEKDWGADDANDRMSRRIKVFECYYMVDTDGDGVAEMTKICVAGEQGVAWMGKEPADCNPFVGTTTCLLPHKFYGLSLYDRLKQIQDQKTFIWRQLLDNVGFQNNARHAVVAGQVNLDDMLTSRPGGIVRTRAPGMIEPLVAPPVGAAGYQMLEYLDTVRTGRAGVSPDTADTANAIAGDTAHGIERLMSAKEELVGLMIRLVANTGYKGILLRVRDILVKHRHGTHAFQADGEWKTVSPSSWRHRWNTSLAPALGSGDRMKRQSALLQVIGLQEKAVANGALGTLVTEKNIYNAACDFVRATNIGDPSPYFTDPESPEAQQARQAKQQGAEQEKQTQIGLMREAATMEHQTQMAKVEATREKAMLDADANQMKLLQQTQANEDDMLAEMTKLELEYGVDVPGSAV